MSRTPRQPPAFESLEPRQMLSGDLTAQLQFDNSAPLAAGTVYRASLSATNPGVPLAEGIPVVVDLFLSPTAEFNSNTSARVGSVTMDGSPFFGITLSKQLEFTVPTAWPNGPAFLMGFVDPQERIPEDNETNNVTQAIAVTTTGGGEVATADLTASVSLVTTALEPDSPIRATVSLRNIGAGDISPSGTSVQLYAAIGQTPAPGTDLLLGTRAVSLLGPGAVDTGVVEFTLPPEMRHGSLRVYAVADPTDETAEVDETNNVSALSLGTFLQGTNDLSGQIIRSTLPAQVVEGQKAPSSASVRYEMHNSGTYSVVRGVTVVNRAYLRPLAAFDDATDIAVSDAQRQSIGGLKAGAVKTADLKIKLPAGLLPGGYWLVVKLDATGAYPEIREANNTLHPGIMFDVVQATVDPGFASGTSTFGAPVAAGKSGSVSFAMSNLGNSAFKSTASIQVFLRDSTGAEVGQSWTFARSFDIKAGGTTKVSRLRISAPAAAGEYTLCARLILPDGVVDVSNLNNGMELGSLVVRA